MILILKPWRRFRAAMRRGFPRSYLEDVGEAGTNAFRRGMGMGPRHSRPGAWPNSQSGALKASIDHVVTDNSVTIGTSPFYARFLRDGTRKMARRKMSDDALREGVEITRGRLGRWVQWTR